MSNCAGVVAAKLGYSGELVVPEHPCKSKGVQFKIISETDEYYACKFHVAQVIIILVSAHNKPVSVSIKKTVTTVKWVDE